jgi:hypothetical protein
MSNLTIRQVPGLHDPNTMALLGLKGADGLEYRIPALDANWLAFQDASGTPGSATVNADRGRCAFASGQSTLTITNNVVTANSVVMVRLETMDATLTQILLVTPTAGSFTLTGNAAATGNPIVRFFVVN